KVSRRDLPFVVAAVKNGATTVASTMIIAALAGIKVFATGGIGGVHRGAEHTFDISADLQELAHTNVTVVCAGAKYILDLGLTTEYLETFGVPLIGYQTKALPARRQTSQTTVTQRRVDLFFQQISQVDVISLQ
ncbi:pseudouridine-5'-phosphate glycosidase, partial [Escherichia coli]